MPGAMPVLNREMVVNHAWACLERAISQVEADRKNYFYPTSRRTQISRRPAALRAWLPGDTDDGRRMRVALASRAHGRDARATYTLGGGSGVDLNQEAAMEIVTEPDIHARRGPPTSPRAQEPPASRRERLQHGEGFAARGGEYQRRPKGTTKLAPRPR